MQPPEERLGRLTRRSPTLVDSPDAPAPGSAPLEDRERVDRRGGAALQSQRGEREEEVPPPALGAGRRQPPELHVVDSGGCPSPRARSGGTGIGQPSTPLGIASLTPSQPNTAMSRSRSQGRQSAYSPAIPSPRGDQGPCASRRASRPVETSRMSPASTCSPCRCSAAVSSSAAIRSPGSSQSPPRSAGMSSSTPPAHDAVLPGHDAVALRAVAAHLTHVESVVHLAVHEDVAERVEVRRRHPVRPDREGVRRAAEARLRVLRIAAADHLMAHRRGVVRRGRHRQRERAAHRHTLADQPPPPPRASRH